MKNGIGWFSWLLDFPIVLGLYLFVEWRRNRRMDRFLDSVNGRV